MLAEKFLLLLETLRSHAHDDGSLRVVSTSPHIAINMADTKPYNNGTREPNGGFPPTHG